MNNLSKTEKNTAIISSMSSDEVEKVFQIEEEILKFPQTKIETSHTFHAGVYSRTIFIPEGVILTGALIKIPTLIIVSGDVVVYINGGPIELNGYNVIPSCANRKQVFIAKTATYLTMIFATNAKTVEDAEEEFTDEFERLTSRKEDAVNNYATGGVTWLEQ